MSVTPRGMSIQEGYREYRAGNFRVNRQYQRKLVWTLDEKRALVDSVLSGYPIPLILLAYTSHEDGGKTYEILDGMQRLNALFSFVENGFDSSGQYFDVNQLSRAKTLAEEGAFVAVSDATLLLDNDSCANFLDYTLAVTEFPAADESAVHEVFGRINAYGRQLSNQEQRQAGVVSGLADVVREISSEIRGDVSQETLDLSEMPGISVDVAGESPSYGITADETFWCKQGVLRRAQLRDSEDEQMVADLVVSVLDGEPFGFSGAKLDDCYRDEDRSAALDAALVKYGKEQLKSDIVGTLSVLRETIESVDPDSNALRRIVHPDAGARSNPIKTAFYAVFFAFFNQCVQHGRSPRHPAAILSALERLQDKIHVSAGAILSSQRVKNINVATGLIQDHFEDREPSALQHGSGATIHFENAIRRSRIETSRFECKQGLLRLDADRTEQVGLLDKIVQTLSAIANVGPGAEGGLFLGVADTKADADRVQSLDGSAVAHLGNRFVVGIDREAGLLGLDVDGYVQRVVQHIAKSSLSDPLKSDVLARVDCVVFRGLSVVCLWVPSQRQYSTVANQVFAREGSSTEQKSLPDEIVAVAQRFD